MPKLLCSFIPEEPEGITLSYVRISPNIPHYCKDLYAHQYTDYAQNPPKYICSGKWYLQENWESGARHSQEKTPNFQPKLFKQTPPAQAIERTCWE